MVRYLLLLLIVIQSGVSATNTVVNVGTSAAGNVAAFSGTDSTSIAPSTSLTITSTNAALTGNLTANGGAFTNALTLGGVAVSTATAANPTGTIGLSAVNGAATTFPRSDSAPALPSTGGAYNGAILVPWITTNNTYALQWKKMPEIYEFLGNAAGDFAGIAVNSGSSSGGATQAPDAQETGVFSYTTGALTNGMGGLRGGLSGITFSTNVMASITRIKTPSALSSSADGYELYVGYGDASTDSEPVDGAYFYYLHSVSNGVWCAKTSNNSARTFASGASVTPPTVTVDTWYNLMVEGNSTAVNFWVSADDSATWQWIGYSSSNIPSTTTRQFGWETYIRKVGGSVGTTARTVYLGRLELWENRQN